MSVPMGFFNDLLQAGNESATEADWNEAGFDVFDPEVDLHENADLTAVDVTAALLAGGAADAHVEIEEWN